jgi:cytochrome c oxidase cbb3-type subunit I/II
LGWQLIIVAAAISLPLGYLLQRICGIRWPIDIAITLIWVVFGINMIGTICKEERHLYVAIGFTWPLL